MVVELLPDEVGGGEHARPDQRTADGDADARRASASARARAATASRTGDTPSSIAEKTGVPLEQILRLNPDLDPQTLAPGQRIKLRE